MTEKGKCYKLYLVKVLDWAPKLDDFDYSSCAGSKCPLGGTASPVIGQSSSSLHLEPPGLSGDLGPDSVFPSRWNVSFYCYCDSLDIALLASLGLQEALGTAPFLGLWQLGAWAARVSSNRWLSGRETCARALSALQVGIFTHRWIEKSLLEGRVHYEP